MDEKQQGKLDLLSSTAGFLCVTLLANDTSHSYVTF